MGKRYGRNQKRKHLEKIKSLSCLNERLSNRVDNLGDLYRELSETVCNYFDKHHEILPPRTVEHIYGMTQQIKFAVIDKVPIESMPHNYAFHHTTLEMVRVLAWIDELQGRLHCRVSIPGHDVLGYFMTTESVSDRNKKEILHMIENAFSHEIDKLRRSKE